jgi:hypothetical protein
MWELCLNLLKNGKRARCTTRPFALKKKKKSFIITHSILHMEGELE